MITNHVFTIEFKIKMSFKYYLQNSIGKSSCSSKDQMCVRSSEHEDLLSLGTLCKANTWVHLGL